MTWRERFRQQEGILESLWGIPVIGALVGALVGTIVSVIDAQWDLDVSLWEYSPSTASSVLTAIIGATAALTGFVVTVTVLVVQMAIGTFSAWVLRLWYRDPLLKGTLALLMGTLAFSFSLLRRIDGDVVPDFGVTLSGVLMFVSLLVFIVFFDRCIRQLRPVAVASDVARTARSAFEQIVRMADRPEIRWGYGVERPGPTLVVHADRGGAIQGLDADGLVRWAVSHGAEIVIPHPVGDYVRTGGDLVRVYGGTFEGAAAEEIQGLIALGDERTFDEDPAFALRVLVDIANRALSPAVNDPTTAVQVLDCIGEVLGVIGSTDLEKPSGATTVDTPAVLVVAARSWEDFVTLGLTEIRQFGATSVQVMRRLRAVMDELLETVRPEHRAVVQAELQRLDATVAQTWTGTVDLDRASTADRQGIGGSDRRGANAELPDLTS